MECILHLAYHLPFRKWSARNDKDKAVMKETKIRIQEQLKKRWLCTQMFQSKKLEQAKTATLLENSLETLKLL